MAYRSGGETIGHEGTTKGLAIGPTLAWRPTKNVRFDLSPLLGCSDHTPAVQVFAVFSFSFGGPAAGDVETPASTRGHSSLDSHNSPGMERQIEHRLFLPSLWRQC